LSGTGDRDDAGEAVQAGEVSGISRIQRQPFRYRGSRDHQVRDSASRFAARGDDRCRHAAEDAGRLGVERHRVKFAFSALQDFQAPRALGTLVIGVLPVVAADLMRPSGQLRQRDGADRHLIGQFGRVELPAQVQVSEASSFPPPEGMTALCSVTRTGSLPP
jgi:hypothetical protein